MMMVRRVVVKGERVYKIVNARMTRVWAGALRRLSVARFYDLHEDKRTRQCSKESLDTR